MSATGIKVLQEAQYRMIGTQVGTYWHEKAKADILPLITTDLDIKEYRHPYFSQSKAAYGTHDYSDVVPKSETPLNYKTFFLENKQLMLSWDLNELNNLGSNIINQKQLHEMSQYVIDVDDSYWHGNFGERGSLVQLNDGILEQSTIVENLNGTTSNLATKGYIWGAIKKMLQTIPWRYRENNPKIMLGMTPNIYAVASDPARIYNDMVEWNLIYKNFMSPEAPQGFKITNLVISDTFHAKANDADSGDGAGAVDTGGVTDDRLFLAILDPEIIGRVVSRGFSMLGATPNMIGGENQNWAMKFGGCVFDANAVLYSEKLVYA